MSDLAALLKANADFYAAFSAGDHGTMSRLWADGDISCIHPGWPTLIGREAVMTSWQDLLANPERAIVECLDPLGIIDGSHGRILCLERIGNSGLAATNLFIRVEGAWRMTHHQASPISVPIRSVEKPPPNRVLH